MTDEGSPVLHYSETESRRFGLRIARGVVTREDPCGQVRDDIARLRPDVAIFRCDAGDTAQIGPLADAGLVPRHADTLVYYRISLDAPRIAPASGADTVIEQAVAGDSEALETVVRRGFANYRNHYHANPLLPAPAILDGYVEWALDYAIRASDGKETWVCRMGGVVRSFATCKLAADRSEIEIVLNATDPAWSGRGLYSSLLRFLIAHYSQTGFASLVISTQVWNYDVQRVWSRAGLVLDRAYDTYHVNTPSVSRSMDTTCP